MFEDTGSLCNSIDSLTEVMESQEKLLRDIRREIRRQSNTLAGIAALLKTQGNNPEQP